MGGDDSLRCLDSHANQRLVENINSWVHAGKLVPGLSNVGHRPGSYVVLLREFRDNSGNWFRFFFCESWRSPDGQWQVIFTPPSNDNPTGACWLEHGNVFMDHNVTLAPMSV